MPRMTVRQFGELRARLRKEYEKDYNHDVCPVWGTRLAGTIQPSDSSCMREYFSPRSGGVFMIPLDIPPDSLGIGDEATIRRISSWIWERNQDFYRLSPDEKAEVPELTPEIVRELGKLPALAIERRIDRGLAQIGRPPASLRGNPSGNLSVLLFEAATECGENQDEHLWLLKELESAGFVRNRNRESSGPYDIVLTLEGLNRLDTGGEGVLSNDAFDLGAHKPLERVGFDLQPGQDKHGHDDDVDDHWRQARIDALVKWFFRRFEDPADSLPYESAEGGYQWIFGGPYDAREELRDNFSGEAEDIIEAAVDEIESHGQTEWAPVYTPEELGNDGLRGDDLSGDSELIETAKELDRLISDMPEFGSDPAFRLGDDGLVHFAVAPDHQPEPSDGDLFDELRIVSEELHSSLAGTNAHADLLEAVEVYRAAVMEDPISIFRLYARGVRLENFALTVRRLIESEDLPQFTTGTEHNLSSVLELHASYIMSDPDGRQLVESAAVYRRNSNETADLSAATEQLSAAVADRPDLFSEEVRRNVAEVSQDVGKGPHPERSNQVAVTSVGNMVAGLLKWTGGITFSTIVAGAVTGSAPGTAAIAAGGAVITAIVAFLTANATLLLTLAWAAGPALAWLIPIAERLHKLCRGRKK